MVKDHAKWGCHGPVAVKRGITPKSPKTSIESVVTMVIEIALKSSTLKRIEEQIVEENVTVPFSNDLQILLLMVIALRVS